MMVCRGAANYLQRNFYNYGKCVLKYTLKYKLTQKRRREYDTKDKEEDTINEWKVNEIGY